MARFARRLVRARRSRGWWKSGDVRYRINIKLDGNRYTPTTEHGRRRKRYGPVKDRRESKAIQPRRQLNYTREHLDTLTKDQLVQAGKALPWVKIAKRWGNDKMVDALEGEPMPGTDAWLEKMKEIDNDD